MKRQLLLLVPLSACSFASGMVTGCDAYKEAVNDSLPALYNTLLKSDLGKTLKSDEVSQNVDIKSLAVNPKALAVLQAFKHTLTGFVLSYAEGQNFDKEFFRRIVSTPDPKTVESIYNDVSRFIPSNEIVTSPEGMARALKKLLKCGLKALSHATDTKRAEE